jgi:hypothetical protein
VTSKRLYTSGWLDAEPLLTPPLGAGSLAIIVGDERILIECNGIVRLGITVGGSIQRGRLFEPPSYTRRPSDRRIADGFGKLMRRLQDWSFDL